MEDSFTVDAVVDNGDSLRHHRFHDHDSRIDDSRVVLDDPVGPYPVGTDLHTVLEWLWQRVVR